MTLFKNRRKYLLYRERKGLRGYIEKRRRYIRHKSGELPIQTIEDLPTRLGIRKFVTSKNEISIRYGYLHRKNEAWKTVKRLLRGSVGMLWDDAYSKILEKCKNHPKLWRTRHSLVCMPVHTKEGVRWNTASWRQQQVLYTKEEFLKLNYGPDRYYVDEFGILKRCPYKPVGKSTFSQYRLAKKEQVRRNKTRMKLLKKYDVVIETFDNYANYRLVNTSSYPFVLERIAGRAVKWANTEQDIIRHYRGLGKTCIVLNYPERLFL